MIRNLKALGLALVAAFALSAVAASMASAQQGTQTSDGPVKGTATETGGAGANRITVGGGFVECPGSTYTINKYNTTPHELVPSGGTTVTVTPHYNQTNHNCSAQGGWKVTIHMNGCDYGGHLGETTGGVEGTYGATLEIVCPTGKEITVTEFTNSTDETNGTQACVLHIKPQAGLTGAHATDTGNGFLDITGTIQNIHVTTTTTGHSILCNQESTTNTASFDIDATVTGKNAEGGATALAYSHP